MEQSIIPLKRITLYKNDLGYFERASPLEQTPAFLHVAKKHKKLVIDTLCTTARSVTFDTEEHNKYIADNNVEQFYKFENFASSSSFAAFLKSCIGAEVILYIKDYTTEKVGKIVMVDEKTLLGSSDQPQPKVIYQLEILNKEGFIRHYDGQSLFNNFT